MDGATFGIGDRGSEREHGDLVVLVVLVHMRALTPPVHPRVSRKVNPARSLSPYFTVHGELLRAA